MPKLIDSTLLVFYVSKTLSSADYNRVKNEFAKKLKDRYGDELTLFVIHREGPTEVDCINPKYISKAEYNKKVARIITEAEAELSAMVDKPKAAPVRKRRKKQTSTASKEVNKPSSRKKGTTTKKPRKPRAKKQK